MLQKKKAKSPQLKEALRLMLVYIHIPKTAGSSFRKQIEAAFPVHERTAIYRTGATTTAQALEQLGDRLPQSRILYGHVPAVIHEHVNTPVEYFTFMRNPIERVISVYKYIKHDFPRHGLHKQIREGLGFDEWVESQPLLSDNGATKMLAGLEEIRNRSEPWMLEVALERLRQMPVVGLSEAYEESVHRVCRVFGWKPVIETANVSSRTNIEFLQEESVAQSTFKLLSDQNSMDLALYEEAKRLFSRRGRGRFHELNRRWLGKGWSR